MCGIVGCLGKSLQEVSEKTIRTMRQSIRYRGQDEQGEWTDNEIIHLFHSRLSIIDLKSGQQPMWDNTSRYNIIFNGEIYNYKDLRDVYTKQGANFYTQSDTEVILEGFKLKGAAVCEDLNGMFAFAIWDKINQKLFLARDRLGKKPLYWCVLNNMFYFASTLDAFRDIVGWTGELSIEGQAQFGLLANFLEDTTIYKQAFSLPFASFAFVQSSQLEPQPYRYWNMDFSQKSTKSLKALIAEYESLLTDAINIRLNSDVPIAITYSGGVDSGTIAAYCAQNLNQSLRCYTIDYHTETDPSAETLIAKRSAAYLGLDWHFIQYDYHGTLLKELASAYTFYSEPCSQLALVYSYHLYKIIKQFATVVLSGNGADELFTGYIGNEKTRLLDLIMGCLKWSRPLFRTFSRATVNYKNHQRLQRIQSPFLQLPPHQAFSLSWQQDSLSILDAHYKSDLLIEQYQNVASQMQIANINNLLDAAMYVNLTCSMNDANYRLPDVSGLAEQIEVRSPYLDYRMVEFAARLPHKFKIGNVFSSKYNKYLPKKAYDKVMETDIVWSHKKGMGYNLKWQDSIRTTVFRQSFTDAFQALEHTALDTNHFRQAWQRYLQGDTSSAGTMMIGFMFGHWINQKFG